MAVQGFGLAKPNYSRSAPSQDRHLAIVTQAQISCAKHAGGHRSTRRTPSYAADIENATKVLRFGVTEDQSGVSVKTDAERSVLRGSVEDKGSHFLRNPGVR